MILPLRLEQALMRPNPNPGFDVTSAQARDDLTRMRREPRPLQRPVVVLAGWRALSLLPRNMIANLGGCFADPSCEGFLPVAYPLETRITRAAAATIAEVEARWPSGASPHTREVDVIGVSMGGLVARAAAAGLADPDRRGSHAKPLRIARLFTLGTPHRGANLALEHPVDAAAVDMLPGSSLLRRLDEAWADRPYEMVCYARLHDEFVGARRTAPPGMQPFWLSGLAIMSHLTIGQEPRILADIARRLRGESPWARVASAPPCD